MRFAVQELGLTDLEGLLTGPTAIAFVDADAVPVAKALRDFARTNPNLVVKGGLLRARSSRQRTQPRWPTSRPASVLLARLAGGLAAPLQQFAGLLQALPRNFAYGLKALIDKQGGAPEPEPEPEPRQRLPRPSPRQPRKHRLEEPPPRHRPRQKPRPKPQPKKSPKPRRLPRSKKPLPKNERRSYRQWQLRKRSSTPSPA